MDKMTALMDASEKSAVNASEMEEEFYECVNGLIEIAGSYGFTGNLWHDYLTLLLVNHENAFSTASEIRGAIEGSINQLALHDFAIFKELYDFDLNVLDKLFHTSCCNILCNYETPQDTGKMFNKRIRDRICEMSKTLAVAKDTDEFMADMVRFYKDFGVGKLGLHKAFRIEHDENGPAQIVVRSPGSLMYVWMTWLAMRSRNRSWSRTRRHLSEAEKQTTACCSGMQVLVNLPVSRES